MDDHLVGSLKERRCLHSRKILPVLDLKDKNKITASLNKHISKCEICEEQLGITTEFINEIKKNIPVIYPKGDILENFQNEIHEIIQTVEIPSTKNNLEFMGAVGAVLTDVYTVLVSRKLIVAFVLGMLLTVLLQIVG